jgi:CPA1 family monovalent cation:H+ antiporter
MHPVTLILLLFALTTALSLAAVRVRIPYPTAMVLAGLLIGVVVYSFPRLDGSSFRLDPDVLFTAILPPLLYGAAWNMSWAGFRDSLRPILLLAIGAVIFTTVGIAGLAMGAFSGFTWPLAFALGAIVSPPDAVAVNAITERLRLRRRITTILDGESLVNDASALVAYRFAVAALLGGAFSLSASVIQFPLVAAGGILIGLLLAGLLHQIHIRIEHPLIETAMTLLAPYAAYLAAEYLHTSGVLAVVTCGLVLSRHSSHLFSPQTRLTAISLWNFLAFILNGLVCILIGLQLPTILRGLHTSLAHALLDAALLCAALILLRLVWVYPATFLPRLIPSIRKKEPRPPAREVFLVGWIGMRGVVSLAAALALPEKFANGAPIAGRDRVLFLTFAVILVTLVGQSLTLPALIRILNVEPPEQDRCEEEEARRRSLNAALDVLAAESESHATSTLRSLYTHRLDHLTDCRDENAPPDPEHALYRRTIAVQRQTLLALRDQGQITDELMRKLERELDLEESRIPVI